MSSKPIIFSEFLIPGILRGQVTHTRRIAKGTHEFSPFEPLVAPYGSVGDAMWVRESHWRKCVQRESGKAECLEVAWFGPNDPPVSITPHLEWWEARSSIHLPKALARIHLRIEGLRCELLWDTTNTDALLALNVRPVLDGTAYGLPDFAAPVFDTPLDAYRWVWDTLNWGYGWDKKNWPVWAIDFSLIKDGE